jgi:hypothetical protein
MMRGHTDAAERHVTVIDRLKVASRANRPFATA